METWDYNLQPKETPCDGCPYEGTDDCDYEEDMEIGECKFLKGDDPYPEIC